MRFFIYLFGTFLCFTLFTSPILAQRKEQPKIINTAEGKKIVYPDGRVEKYSLSGTPSTELAISTYPIFNADIRPLDNPIAVTEDDLAKIAFRRSQITKQAADIASARAEKATQKRLALARQLEQTSNQDQQTKIELELENAVKIEEKAMEEMEQAKVIADDAELFVKGGNYVEAFIQEREKQRRALQYSRVEGRSSSIGIPIPFGETYISPVSHAPNQSKICTVNFDGIDEETNRWMKVLQPTPFFSFTDDRLRTILKDQEYLRCEGYLSTTSGFTYVTLKFAFAYPNAREAYGIIEENSILTIKMIDGHYINLLSGNMADGKYDLETQQLTYQVSYLIDRSQLNILRKSEIDVVLVFWSTGYEEYPVYHMDFFKRQLECLD